MSIYHAPLADIQFVMNELAGLEQVSKLPGFEDASADTVTAILDEAAKFATNVLDPLNVAGDREGAKWFEGGTVTTPAGFKDAYEQYCANGWNGLTKSPEYGGQGLPQLVATAVEEMWHAANLAFDLCPLLTQGAIEAIELRGSDALKEKFLPKMVAGTWTGTMNLTEPQAGSDLAAVRTRAVPQGDGSYKLFGQKIFITFGEHDYTENIVHLVLARTPDAPEGVKGISLFVVPKFIVNADGSLGARNDVHCVSIEHKLGIHASPTAVLAYGDKGGAVGYLVGEENRGLEYMFIMMNLARFSVGLEGVGISERAYQRAVAYARDRVQGKAVGLEKGAKTGAIIDHPDIRRMLMTMRGYTEATRAVAYVTAAALDNAANNPDAAARAKAQAFADFMIPIVKGWSTEVAQEVTSLGLQVHGGMGFIEETGAAQHVRDARIITIYEGTTGIQANDLIGRKTARDGGAVARAVAAEIDKVAARLAARSEPALQAIGVQLAAATADLQAAVEWMVPAYGQHPRAAHAVAVAYLKLWGLAAGGWQMGRAALIAADHVEAGTGNAKYLHAKIATARFYADCLLPQASAFAHTIIHGSESALGLEVEAF
jgi:alkylation response protein AidB-like acyl-CoA dehydrogenase